LPGVAEQRVNALGWLSPKLKDLFISEMIACQKQLSKMYQDLQTSGPRHSWEDMTASTTLRADLNPTTEIQGNPGLDSVGPLVRHVLSTEPWNNSGYSCLPRCGKNISTGGCGNCDDCLSDMKSPTYDPFLGSLPSESFSVSSVQDSSMEITPQAVDPSIESFDMDEYIFSQFPNDQPTKSRATYSMDSNGGRQ
jgi:hypothetical protein